MVVLVLGHAELRIGGPFDALPIHNADVRAEVEGIVDEICVQEGGFVAQGGVVARLSDRDHRAELRKIAAESDEARARLKLLEAGSRAEEIELARTTIGKNEERVKFGKSRLGRDQLLFDQKLISAKELEDSEAYLADRQNEVAEAAGRLDLLRAGSRPEAIEEVKAEITRLEAQRFYIDEQRQLLTVVSPCEGIVATPARQLMEMRHQLIKKGDLIAKVFDLKTITAEIIISEREIADIQLGQKVMLKVRAFPDRTFIGKVTSIATSAQINSTSTSANQPVAPTTTAIRNTVAPKTVLVTSEIENSSLLLKPEMTGQAKIFCGQRRLIDLVTRRIVRTLKVQFWSWL
jgi:multidrug resistance efflux pump